MKKCKIVLAGGQGYLGTVLCRYFQARATEIIVLGRKKVASNGKLRYVVWDGKTPGAWVDELEQTDLVINLCGKNVNCRYTDLNKEEILNSRLEPTQTLGRAIQLLKEPPACWINISSATIYRHAEDYAQTDSAGAYGYGFSVDVCKAWEQCFFSLPTPHTRKLALRLGIVLGRSDGAFPRLLNLARLGLGGKQGAGSQYISWIHEQDAARAIEWLFDHPALEGTVNCTAPNPVPQKSFMQALRKAVGQPIALSTPVWLLELGAYIIGTETELLLKSRWVVPEKLLASGFKFQYATHPIAIHELLANRN